MKHAGLCARLDAAADRFTSRVLGEMYRDPFWQARFGERAERHGRKDGRYHIDYLIQALQADDSVIMWNYARWLQQVLTSRGMATHHLDENFELLAAAIRTEGWPDAAAATAMLDTAREALRYSDGPQRALQEAADRLAAAAAEAMQSPHSVPDLRSHIDYIADAIALRQPELFAKHATWLAGFVASRAELVKSLVTLARVAPAIVPAAATELCAVIEPSLAALDGIAYPQGA